MVKSFFKKFVKVCPKTGRIRKFINPGGIYTILLPIVGLIALLWIIVRVVPKPSRIQYPCMQVATPLASGFLAYFSILLISLLAFFKTKKKVFLSPYLIGFTLLLTGFTGTYLINEQRGEADVVLPNSEHVTNAPSGEAKGIYPGRVVWVHNPDATNEKCDPSKAGHGWWMPENNNQEAIDRMISRAIQELTGETSDKSAWNEIFMFHNETRGKGRVNYVQGEKVFIKVNNVSGWGGNFSTRDLSVSENGSYGISETSPQVVLAVLRHLVNVIGVNQSDIYVGDPMRNLYKHCYDMWHDEFPDVHYMSHDDYASLGREKVVTTLPQRIFSSDKGMCARKCVECKCAREVTM